MEKYVSLVLQKLLEFDTTPCDIYVKLNEGKYVKILKADDFFDVDQLLSYLNKGAKAFYIKVAEEARWQRAVADRQIEKLKPENINMEILHEQEILDSFKVFREQAVMLGMEKKTAKLVKSAQENIIKRLKTNSLSFGIVARLARKNNNLSSLSFLTSVIVCSSAIKMSWSSRASLEAFILAGLFHDVTITSDRVGGLRSEVEIDESFSQSEIEEFFSHPVAASELLETLGFKSKSAQYIVKHHHEMPDGSGFPDGLRAREISPKCCLFILSSEIARSMNEANSINEGWEIVSRRFKDTYSLGNFKKPMEGIVKSFPSKIRC